MNNIKHILISRIDNIGDVILTLPLAAILKKHLPHVKITFLGREYVRAVTEHCPDIDAFYSWDALSHLSKSDAVAQIKSWEVDGVIHALANKTIAGLMKKANVPYRIGTSRRWYHWLTCNERVNFTRSKSDLHELQLNLKLLQPLGIEINESLEQLSDTIHLTCSEALPPHLKTILKPDQFNLIIHPFTNGHTREWPISHFIALIRQLPRDRINVIVTGSKKESIMIQNRIASQCEHITNLAGQCSLRELIQLIAHADGLFANATGPLHLAAALGIHTLGLYPATKGIDPNRWKPIGKKAEYLVADPGCQQPRCRAKNDCLCMESITVEQVKNKIMQWIAYANQK